MNAVFGTRPVAFLDGIAILAVGALLLVTVEAEKRVRHRLLAPAPV